MRENIRSPAGDTPPAGSNVFASTFAPRPIENPMTPPRAVYQVLPNLTAEDAVGEYAWLLRRLFAGWGCESRLYVKRTTMSGTGSLNLTRLPSRVGPGEVMLYHHSIGCAAAQQFAAVRTEGGVKAVIYHNVTPPDLLGRTPQLAARAHQGLSQLGTLAANCDFAVADSAFNVGDLAEAGFRDTRVVHLALADDRRGGLANAAARRARGPGPGDPPHVLHVGRMLPHKALEDVIQVFAIFRRTAGGRGRLRLVGDPSEAPAYIDGLRALANAEGLADHVDFVGHVDAPALFDEYARADAYLCASRHEGFCVPLIECMAAGVPFLGWRAGAMAEVAEGAALLLPGREPATLAEALSTALHDPAARATLLKAQAARSDHFTETALDDRWRHVLCP